MRRKKWIAAACLAGLLTLGGLVWAGRDRVGTAEVALVLGNRVQPDGEPGAVLRGRLERALAIHQAGHVEWICVSGGLGAEGHQEAEVMAEFLVARGVPRAAIVIDREGWTTFDSARNLARVMRARGWRRALAVSSYYHQARCRLALERAGVPEVYSASSWEPRPRDLYALPSEALAYLYYAGRSW